MDQAGTTVPHRAAARRGSVAPFAGGLEALLGALALFASPKISASDGADGRAALAQSGVMESTKMRSEVE